MLGVRDKDGRVENLPLQTPLFWQISRHRYWTLEAAVCAGWSGTKNEPVEFRFVAGTSSSARTESKHELQVEKRAHDGLPGMMPSLMFWFGILGFCSRGACGSLAS